MTAERKFMVRTGDEEQTMSLAGRLAYCIPAGRVIGLSGDLGAGKTVFVRGFIRQLAGGDLIVVRSPTFTLMNFYKTTPAVCHMDLYRLESLEDAIGAGLEEFCPFEDGLCLVEWPEHVPGFLPDDTLGITIEFMKDDQNGRNFIFSVPDQGQWDELVNILCSHEGRQS